MRTLRNVVWGVLAATWLAGTISVVVVFIVLVSAEAREDLRELGGLLVLFLGYAGAAVLCGITLGLLRPLTADEDGARLVGAILHAEAFIPLLLLLSAIGSWDAGFEILILAVVASVIGWFMTPLWQSSFSNYFPDFDRWLDGLVHTTDLGDNPSDDDGAA